MSDAIIAEIAPTVEAFCNTITNTSRPIPVAVRRPEPAAGEAGRQAPERVFDILDEMAPRDAI